MINEKEAKAIIEYSKKNFIWIDIVTKEYVIIRILDKFKREMQVDYLVLKWWTCLSLFYWSWRFSEDIDLDLLLIDWQDSTSERIMINNTYRLKNLLKKLDTKTNWLFEFEIKEKIARWVFHFKWSYWIPDVDIKFDIRLRSFTEWLEKEIVKEKDELVWLWVVWLPFSFNCLSPIKIASNKLICIWWREKWRDLYDFLFLIKNWYKIDINYIRDYLYEYNERKNEFYWVEDKEDLKRKLLERIDFLDKKNQNELLWDINNFLIIDRRIEKDSFFIELYSLIEEKFDLITIDNKDIENQFNIEDFDLPDYWIEDNNEINIKKQEIIEFLESWSKKWHFNWWAKRINKDFVIVIENNLYCIYEWSTLYKKIEYKKDLIDYLYKNYDIFFK